ncbi:MAG: VanZ family protein [Gemmatimonadota bacterium]|nr:VanZ family protein [Gemmatimonadota bacterium]
MLFERSPTSQEIAVAAILLVILVITLSPAGNGPPLQFSFELGVGRRWLADGILNLCLFTPFGLALGWKARSPAKVVFYGLLLSTSVELAQMWIPGRDPSLSDIVANTTGTAVGALIGLRHRFWLAPDARSSVSLTALGVGAATLVMTLTAVLAAPEGSFAISRAGSDLVIEYQSRANAIGLDSPAYWLPHAFPDSSHEDIGSASVRRDGARWYVSVRGRRATLGPTVGKGWTLLAYTDAIAHRLGEALDVAWVFLLCVPIGFWVRRRTALAAVCALVLVLFSVPAITGVVSTPLIEWIGAALGFVAGASLGWFSCRLLNGPGEKTSLSERRR